MTTPLLSPADLAELVARDEAVLLDARPPAAYGAGHLPGAINVPQIFDYMASSDAAGLHDMAQQFAALFGTAGLDGSKTAVVYEQSMTAGLGRSCRGYFLLCALGYPKAAVLHGGLAAWSAAGHALSTEVPEPTPAEFPLDLTAASAIVGKDEILAALDDPSVTILDVRDVAEWIGESSSPADTNFCPRKGRIPSARWLEWYRLMKPSPEGPVIKAPGEVLAELATVGITRDTPVYLYCFKGSRASNSFLALKQAGVKDVRIYLGSWNEWSRDPALPIEEGPPYSA